jgi:hypothetical protein
MILSGSHSGTAGITRVGSGGSDLLSGYRVPASRSITGQGMNFSVNGVNVSGAKSFFSSLTMIGFTIGTGYFVNDLVGYKKVKVKGYDFKEPTDKYFMGFGLSGKVMPIAISSVLVMPVTGAINSLIWKK